MAAKKKAAVKREKRRPLIAVTGIESTTKQLQDLVGKQVLVSMRAPNRGKRLGRNLDTLLAKPAPGYLPPNATERDLVLKAAHYNKSPSGVEAITVIRHMPFNVGTAVKYLWRQGEKPIADGTPVDNAAAVRDLNKALYYIRDEIKRLGGQVIGG